MKIILYADGGQFENKKLLSKSFLEHLLRYYKDYFDDVSLLIAGNNAYKNEYNLESEQINLEKLADDELVLIVGTNMLLYAHADEEMLYQQFFIEGKKLSILNFYGVDYALALKARDLKAISTGVADFWQDEVIEKIKTKFEQKDCENHNHTTDALLIDNNRDLYNVFDTILDQSIDEHLDSNVLFIRKESSVIEIGVKIGKGTTILPNCYITGDTVIGENCVIGPNSTIENSVIGNGVNVKNSTLIDSKVDDNTNIGPYAYLRPKSDIGKHCKIGDFVEVKNTRIDDGSKVSHLSYIGDGKVGKDVNIGCGTVFVNYDGKNKHLTTVEDNAFVGCNSNLVAPVTVKKGAYVAAGSTITDEVPADNLAIARARQVNKDNWQRKE